MWTQYLKLPVIHLNSRKYILVICRIKLGSDEKSLSTDKLFQWRMKNEQCNGNVVCAVYKGDPGIGNASGSPHLKFCCDRQTGGRTDRQHTISITIRHFAMRALPGKNSGTNKRRKRKSMNFQSGKQSIMQSVKTDRRMPATYGWRQ